MKKFATIRHSLPVLLALCAATAHADSNKPDKPDPLTFTGTIGIAAVENNQRNSKHPSMLVLTMLNANGDRIKFCNTALMPWNLAIATTNGKATSFQNAVDHGKATKTKLIAVASEDTTDSDGMYCGIKSLTAAP